MGNTCKNCEWYAADKGNGQYDHELAVKNGRGICLNIQLETHVPGNLQACEDFFSDGVKRGVKTNG